MGRQHGNCGNEKVGCVHIAAQHRIRKQHRCLCMLHVEIITKEKVLLHALQTPRRMSLRVNDPNQDSFLSTSPAQQSSMERRKMHSKARISRKRLPVQLNAPALSIDFITFQRTNPSHRPTNRIQPAASASLGLIQHLASIL